MAELHPNQIPYEAPEPALANFAAPRDYISQPLARMAKVIEDTVEFNMKLDDVSLAAKVKANKAAGIQNIRNGDAVGGDYTALKNDALALYQVSFEGASPSAVKRYMRMNPNELQEYELEVEAVTAEKENKAADVRIRKEMSNITSRVALGQISWTDAVKMLHVMGGDKITSDQYEAYTAQMRSDIDNYQAAMYLSGDMQSQMIALEKAADPNEWTSMSATDRAKIKTQAQNNINGMLKSLDEKKEKKEDEPYKTIRNSIVNSSYWWRDMGDGDQLDLMKQMVEDVAVKGQMTYIDPMTKQPVVVKYSDITPEQWGAIRKDLDSVQLHSLKQKEADTDFMVTAKKLESNLDQGYANTTMSSSEQLATLTGDPRAVDILSDTELTTLKLKSSEFVDRVANALRPSVDIDTKVSKSVALGGLIRTVSDSPWTAANNLAASADYQKFITDMPRFQKLLSQINLGLNGPITPTAYTVTELGKTLLKEYGTGSAMDKILQKSPGSKVAYNAFKTALDEYHLAPGDVAGIITGDYSKAEALTALNTAQATGRTLIKRLKDTVFNGEYAPELVDNSRMEYVTMLAGLIASKRDIAKFGESLGLPRGLELDPQIIAAALRSVGTQLETLGIMNQLVTNDTRKEDSELFLKALGLDRITRTPEQMKEWESLVYAAGWAQSNKNGVVSRYLDSDSADTLAEPEKLYGNVLDTLNWTGRSNKRRQ